MLIVAIISLATFTGIGQLIGNTLMLFVPCGLPMFRSGWLFVVRQLFFGTLGLMALSRLF
jgi:hypothetical protein